MRQIQNRMRHKLVVNRHKHRWLEEDLGILINGLYEEVTELRHAVEDEGTYEMDAIENVWEEAADVANFAAMIASRYERMVQVRCGGLRGEHQFSKESGSEVIYPCVVCGLRMEDFTTDMMPNE